MLSKINEKHRGGEKTYVHMIQIYVLFKIKILNVANIILVIA